MKYLQTLVAGTLAVLLAFGVSAQHAHAQPNEDTAAKKSAATLTVSGEFIDFAPRVEFERAIVRIAGPEGYALTLRVPQDASYPTADLLLDAEPKLQQVQSNAIAQEGRKWVTLPEGKYNYELVLYSDDGTRQSETGHFFVKNGKAQQTLERPHSGDELSSTDNPGLLQRATTAILDFLIPSAHAQSVSGESLLLERGVTGPFIRFNHTDSVDHDWYISGNDTRIQISDNLSGLQPLYLENNAAQHSIYVKGGSTEPLTSPSVGIGTSAPQQALHVVGSNVRIEQTSSTWDFNPGSQGLWFNQANPDTKFGVLKLQNNAPANSIVATATGIGVGTDAPNAPIHVWRDDDTFEMITLDQANTSVVQDRNMMQLNNNGGIRFQFDNEALGTQWRFQAATGNADVFEIAKVGTGNIELELDASGNLTIDGTLTQQSDVNSKHDIEDVDAEEVLSKLANLQVSEWTYKTDTDGVRHLGPMAQDFYSAFALGDDDTKIAPGDMAGVALVAIQAQQRLIREQQAEIDALRSELTGIRKLEARLAQIEKRLLSKMVYNN